MQMFLKDILQLIHILVKTKRTYTIDKEIQEILEEKGNKSEYIERAVKEKHLNDLSKTVKIEATLIDG